MTSAGTYISPNREHQGVRPARSCCGGYFFKGKVFVLKEIIANSDQPSLKW